VSPRPRHVPPFDEIRKAFREHELLVFSAALGLRVLASLVPLTLLGLALLGVFGLQDVWRDSLAPALQDRVTRPVYRGIDYTVQQLFREDSAAVIAFAAALALWHISRGMRITMKALNVIHDEKESRSWRRLLLTDLVLALVIGTCVIGAFVLVVTLPRLAHGVLRVPLYAGAWLGAAALLALAIGIVVRYAPVQRPEASWASAGSILVVVTWLVTSLLFGLWAGSVANYKSAVGTLTAFLLLTTYVLISTTIFLAGAQLDELARKGGRR
jgi:membrane protein